MRSSFLDKFSKDFWVLFVVSCLLMFGFAFYQSTTVLYLHLNFNKTFNNSYELSATFSALVYFCSVVCGYLTQKFISAKSGLKIGLALCALATVFTAINIFDLFLLGLSIFAAGYGFVYTNAFYLLGNLYPINDARRESAFLLAYVGFNIGSLFGFFLGGIAIQYHSYAVLILVVGFSFILITTGLYLISGNKTKTEHNSLVRRRLLFFTLSFILTLVLWALLANFEKVRWYLIFVSTFMLLSMFYLVYLERKNRQVAKKLLLLGILTLTTVIYWTIYKLQDGLLITFFQEHVSRAFLNIVVPAPTLLIVNPLVILICGPLLSFLWTKCDNKWNTPSNKVFFGLIVFGLGFLFLILGLKWDLPMSIAFVVIFLVFVSLSELIFGPGTISMVGQLACKKYHIMLLGIVQLSTSLSSIFSGYLSVVLNNRFLNNPHFLNKGYFMIFALLGGGLLLSSFVAFFSKRLITHEI